jgi:hypothetical protein
VAVVFVFFVIIFTTVAVVIAFIVVSNVIAYVDVVAVVGNCFFFRSKLHNLMHLIKWRSS